MHVRDRAAHRPTGREQRELEGRVARREPDDEPRGGDEEAEEGLLACLARGADRGIRVWDGSLEGADVLQVARVLSAVVERESPDLVLCGVTAPTSLSYVEALRAEVIFVASPTHPLASERR